MMIDMGDLDEAESLFRRALVIDEQTFGRDHPHVIMDLTNLAGVLYKNDKLDDAKEAYERCLADEQQHQTCPHERSHLLCKLARVLEKQGEPGAARCLLED